MKSPKASAQNSRSYPFSVMVCPRLSAGRCPFVSADHHQLSYHFVFGDGPIASRISRRTRYPQDSRPNRHSPNGLFYVIREMAFLHPADGQEIGEGPHHSIADIVLRPPKPPGAMVYLDLRDCETLHLGKGRKKAVHAIEELHVFQTFPLKS